MTGLVVFSVIVVDSSRGWRQIGHVESGGDFLIVVRGRSADPPWVGLACGGFDIGCALWRKST